jgi:tight adherence protein B
MIAQLLPTNTLGSAVVVVLVFAAVFVLAWMLLGAQARAKRDRELQRLMRARSAQQIEQEGVPSEVATGPVAWMPHGLVAAGEKVAQAGGVTEKIDAKLETGGLAIRSGELVAMMFAAGFTGAVFAAIILPNILFILVMGAAAAFVPYLLVMRTARKRVERMHEQLPDILMILASSLRAGHSFLQALDMVAKEVGEPASVEFSRVVAEIRLGRELDDALNAMADRIGSDDLHWAVLAVNIQRQVGGNLAEVLDTVAETVRERDWIRRQVRVLSAEGRLSISILIVLPFLIGLYIAIVNPSYVSLLFSDPRGLVMLAVGGILMGIGIVWMRKVVEIDV